MKGAALMVGGGLLVAAGLYLTVTSGGKSIGYIGLVMGITGVFAFMYGGRRKG